MAAPAVPRSELELIAARLIAAREAMSLSQAQLCRATGIASNTYAHWEMARNRPSLEQAYVLYDKLGWTLDYIYKGKLSGMPPEIIAKLAPPPAAKRA